MGTAAGRGTLRQRGGGQLPRHPRSGHAADVPREHGGRCHERGGGAEGRLPVQYVGLLPPHRGGGAPAAPVRDEGISLRDPPVQPLHLRRKHRAAAVQLRPAAAAVAVAGSTGSCGDGRCRGGAGAAEAPDPVAGGRGALAAGGGGAGRCGDDAGLLRGGMAAGPRRGAAGRGGRGEKTQKQIRWGDRPLGRKNGGLRLSDTGPEAKEDFL